MRSPAPRRRGHRTPGRTRTCAGALAAALASALVAVLAASSPAGAAAPLDAGVTAPTASWAVVAMGHLGQPLNTFWELLVRPAGTSRWELVTPPGVADNGGLVAAVDPAGGPVTAGFEPSQLLRFSPLAGTTDLGAHYTTGLVPDALAAVPDALAPMPGAVAPGGSAPLLALSRTAGGTVLEGHATDTHWVTVIDRATLAETAARSCRPGALTAVATFDSGQPIVAARCTAPRAAAIFTAGTTRHGWSAIGPLGASDVVRLVRTGSDIVALDEQPISQRSVTLTTLWHPASSSAGPWSRTASLVLPKGTRLVSTAVTSTGDLLALVRRPAGHLQLYEATPPRAAWQLLPTPPAGTTTVASTDPGDADAFIADGSQLTVYALSPSGTRWLRVQRMAVPIAYGSSG